MDQNYYIGLDLSTQQIKGLVVRSDLKLIHEAIVDFDAEYSQKYGVTKGVVTNPSNGEIFMPTDMWLEAIDLLLERLKADGLEFSRVMCLSGAGMQHGIVNWNYEAENMLQNLKPEKTLVQQLSKAFARPYSPNWQDASTQSQCDEFNAALGSEKSLADTTGSKAHHRFSGPQILRCRQVYPDVYKNTARISLVSSFLACIFSGDFAPIDISDVCGADLRDIKKGEWDTELMNLTAGSREAAEDLKEKLGSIPEDGGTIHSKIHPYFIMRYGFNPECSVCVSTGDNPATILSLPLRPSDAIVSLGTSTTFLMSTPSYLPDPSYHFMNHPTTPGLYMFMLCYKNGSAAREQIRDVLNQQTSTKPSDIWETYNNTVTSTPPLNQPNPEDDTMKLGLYFPRSEIVPLVPPGTYRFTYQPSTETLAETTEAWSLPTADARAVIESQLLSCRLRSQRLVTPQTHPSTGASLPPQPRRIYLAGGGSVNPAIQQLVGEVLGGVEGVYRLDIGGNACGLGAAYKAVWAAERDKERGETFEELVGRRWKEEEFVKRVDVGYRKGVWERYGEAVKGFEAMEKAVLQNVK